MLAARRTPSRPLPSSAIHSRRAHGQQQAARRRRSGPIALAKDGDIIALDTEAGSIELEVSERHLAERRMVWRPRLYDFRFGALWKYAQAVGDACNGAVTHPGARAETHVYADIWTRSPPRRTINQVGAKRPACRKTRTPGRCASESPRIYNAPRQRTGAKHFATATKGVPATPGGSRGLAAREVTSS
jgi:hypothetical protein